MPSLLATLRIPDTDTLAHGRRQLALIRAKGTNSDLAHYLRACRLMAQHYRHSAVTIRRRPPIADPSTPSRHWAFSNDDLAASNLRYARAFYLILSEGSR